MARHKNPSFNLLPLLIFGGAAAYFFAQSGKGASGSGGKKEVVQLQIALNNLLGTIFPSTPPDLIPQPYTGVFDQPTANAYVIAFDTVLAAMETATNPEVLPTGDFTQDLEIPIVKPSGDSKQPASSAFLAWLVSYWYAPSVTLPTAVSTFRNYARANFTTHPDERALRDAAISLYPKWFPR